MLFAPSEIVVLPLHTYVHDLVRQTMRQYKHPNSFKQSQLQRSQLLRWFVGTRPGGAEIAYAVSVSTILCEPFRRTTTTLSFTYATGSYPCILGYVARVCFEASVDMFVLCGFIYDIAFVNCVSWSDQQLVTAIVLVPVIWLRYLWVLRWATTAICQGSRSYELLWMLAFTFTVC